MDSCKSSFEQMYVPLCFHGLNGLPRVSKGGCEEKKENIDQDIDVSIDHITHEADNEDLLIKIAILKRKIVENDVVCWQLQEEKRIQAMVVLHFNDEEATDDDIVSICASNVEYDPNNEVSEYQDIEDEFVINNVSIKFVDSSFYQHKRVVFLFQYNKCLCKQ